MNTGYSGYVLASFLALLQIMLGYLLSNVYSDLVLVLHSGIGLALFITGLWIYFFQSDNPLMKRMAIGTLAIIVVNGGIGAGFVLFSSNPFYTNDIPYLHLFLALGVLSNYTYMAGYNRKLD